MTREAYIAEFVVTTGAKNDHGFVAFDGTEYIAMPCKCGASDCKGWAMVPKNLASYHNGPPAPPSLPTGPLQEIFKPQDHEVEITRHFGKKAYYTGGRLFDFPLTLIGFSNRSGSNLLAEYLYSTGLFGIVEEYINFNTVIDSGFESVPEYIVDQVRTAGGRLPGFKANWTQVVMIHRLGIDKMFSGVNLINNTRRDALGQAISFSIADQTMQWTSNQTAGGEASYNFDDVCNRLHGTLYSNDVMQLLPDVLRMRHVDVTYEEVEASPQDVVKKICDAFGLTAPQWVPGAASISKQRTSLNHVFRNRFLSDCRNLIFNQTI